MTGGVLEDGAQADTGVIRNVTPADVTFLSMDMVDIALGTGNDDFTINTTLANTMVGVDGGDGDDEVTVLRIGDETKVSGAIREDTVTVVIDGFPVAGQFTDLELDVETLVVDNSGNTDQGVAWIHKDGVLQADTIPGGTPFDVIITEGSRRASTSNTTTGRALPTWAKS